MIERPRTSRPVPVTVAVVLVAIGAALSIVTGLLVLLSRYRVDTDVVLTVSLLGAATVLFGLLNLALAAGVARGSRAARLLVTVFSALEIATHVVTIVTTDGWDVSAIVDLAMNVVVIVAIWAPPGARYFRAASPTAD